MNKNTYNYQIDLSKHKILSNLSEEYLPHVLDEIFGIGYNTWLKNYIRNDIIINENSNNITESKLSSTKGQHGENIVVDLLIEKFKDIQVENTSKIPHSGDIQLTIGNGKKFIVEVKNYNNTINQEQIDKLKFDMKFCSINFAIFVSLNSGIVGKKRFEIESFYHAKTNYYILYLPYSMHKNIPSRKYIITHNSYEESISNLATKLEYSICILKSISNSIIKFNNNLIINNDYDYLISELNNYYEDFKMIKNSCLKLEENIKKNIDSHLNSIKDYESSIKNNINRLIKNKFKMEKNNLNPNSNLKLIKIIKKSDNDWDILQKSKLIGKITYFDNQYDLVINNSKYYINEFFDTYEECEYFIFNIKYQI